MAFSKPQPLDEERVRAFRAELDAFIDRKVEEERKHCPGVPAGSIRIMMTRGLGCQCAAFLQIKADEAREGAA